MRRRETSLRDARAGLSLLEILVSMLILTVGATSLIALFASASSTHKRAVDNTHAALVAEEVFATVASRYRHETDIDTVLDGVEQALPEKIDGYYWAVTLFRPGKVESRDSGDSGDSGDLVAAPRSTWGETELVVRVTVKWSRNSAAREEEYWTILLPRS